MPHDHFIAETARAWTGEERWKGIERPYSAADVAKLRGSLQIEYTLAKRGCERLGSYCTRSPTSRAWLL